MANNAGSHDFVLLENVLPLAVPAKGMQTSNLDSVVDMLEAIDLAVVVWHLGPEDWGVPAHRPRLWILAVSGRVIEKSGWVSKEAFKEAVCEAMDGIVGSAPAGLSEYILPDDDPHIQSYLRDCAVRTHMRDGDPLSAILAAGGHVPRLGAWFCTPDAWEKPGALGTSHGRKVSGHAIVP